jgi:hypothetical protein
MKRVLLLLLLVCLSTTTLSGTGNVLYFNNIARPMGMGGAFTAVEDSLQTHLYNPAAAEFTWTSRLQWSTTFDLIRALYIFIMLLDNVQTANGDDVKAMAFLALVLSTANISLTSDTFFFKLNFMDQLISQGPDYPMYSSSFTMGIKFRGFLTGFQTGVTGHLYNLFSPGLPQGHSVSWGLFYRSRPDSPFSLGLFYFHASDDMPWVRKPFEQVLNNTFNFGAAYEFPGRYTLAFDLRNINNFNLDAYLQPHLGLEKVFALGNPEKNHATLALRVGTYWDSETEELGYSGGFDFRYYFRENTFGGRLLRALRRSGYLYVSWTLTREENVATYDRILRENHIISVGAVF